MSNVKSYVGIDVGVNGAIGLVQSDDVVAAWDMPTSPVKSKNKKRHEVDAVKLAQLIRSINSDHRIEIVGVEHVHAMPGQGVCSMFNFGDSFGIVRGILAALEYPCVYVPPITWKKRFDLCGKDKDKARTTAIKMFPAYTGLTRKRDVDRADAILIAQYVRQCCRF